MTVIAIILLLIIAISFFAYVSPLLIGLVIIGLVNGMSKALRGKYAPILWNVLTFGVTVYATAMLWKDLFSDAVDMRALPFEILIIYGLVSVIFIAILYAVQQSKSQPAPAPQKKFEQSSKPSVSPLKEWQRQENWEDYPEPNYDAIHTYCEVAFDESGRTFYYRTRNPDLEVGDEVYVPVGYKYQKKIGTIVSMEDYLGWDAPFPLERTKHIIGKVE